MAEGFALSRLSRLECVNRLLPVCPSESALERHGDAEPERFYPKCGHAQTVHTCGGNRRFEGGTSRAPLSIRHHHGESAQSLLVSQILAGYSPLQNEAGVLAAEWFCGARMSALSKRKICPPLLRGGRGTCMRHFEGCICHFERCIPSDFLPPLTSAKRPTPTKPSEVGLTRSSGTPPPAAFQSAGRHRSPPLPTCAAADRLERPMLDSTPPTQDYQGGVLR